MRENRSILASLSQSSVRFYGALFLVLFTLLLIMVSLASGYRDNLTEMRKGEIKRLVEVAINTINPIIERHERGELSRDEAIERVREIVSRMTYKSETMDNYVFMSSYDGIMLVQPLEPHLQNTYQWDARDAKGIFYIRDLVAAASSPEGEGFVFYYYPPPGSSNPGKKLSYVRGLPSLRCYIGTGMFFHDINSLVFRYLLSPLFIIVVVFCIISLLFAFFLRPIALCFRILVRTFHEISSNPAVTPEIPLNAFRPGTEEHGILLGFEQMLETMAEYRKQIIQADKLSSLGVLVAGVAHEINNPNQFVLSNAGILEGVFGDLKPVLEEYYRDNGDFSLGGMNYSVLRGEIPKYLKGIEEGALRINRIVSDLKSYSRMDEPERFSPLDINTIIDSAITLCHNLIKNSTYNFQWSPNKNLPRILGSLQKIEQVVINLIQNACHSLPEKDKGIFITTALDTENSLVKLVIRDEGSGIHKEHLNRITDPFYTTKRHMGGLGLGLSVSQGIINEHNGIIEISSEAGAGTTVAVSFPAYKENARA